MSIYNLTINFMYFDLGDRKINSNRIIYFLNDKDYEDLCRSKKIINLVIDLLEEQDATSYISGVEDGIFGTAFPNLSIIKFQRYHTFDQPRLYDFVDNKPVVKPNWQEIYKSFKK